MKNTILGLDLGSASIGWTLLQADENGKPQSVLDCGVRIFDSGRDAGKGGGLGVSKAVARRESRGKRRLLNRKNMRIKGLSKLFDKYNMSYLHNLEIINTNPYYLRDKALKEKLSLQELARVILHLGKHRGFKSNRKQGESGGKLKLKFKELEAQLDELTLGQYLHKQYYETQTSNGNPNGITRFKKGEDNNILPTRAMYMDEFNRIKNFQQPLHALDKDFWDRAENYIFYQRPLKAVEKGKCSYYRDQDRAYKALPIFQKYRILDKLLNLTYIDSQGVYNYLKDNNSLFTTLYNALQTKEKLTFDQVRTTLKLDKDIKFRLEDGTSKHIEGNKTNCAFIKFIPSFANLSLAEQTKITEIVLKSNFIEDLEKANINWQDLLEKNKSLEESLEDLFDNIKLEDDVASFCENLLNDVTEVMEKDHIPVFEAIEKLSYNGEALKWGDNKHATANYDKLPYYGEILTTRVAQKKDEKHIALLTTKAAKIEAIFGKVGNPSVHVNLNQLQKLVNAIIEKYGKPEYISIESSRELLGAGKYKDTITSQNENNKENTRRKTLLEGCGIKPTNDNLLKLKLWEELKGGDAIASEDSNVFCPYCNETPIGFATLFNNNQVQIEHIIPQSQSFDDNFKNLTLACAKCNQNKNNQTPYEFNPNLNTAKIMANDRMPFTKKWRFLAEARNIFEKALDSKLTREEETKYGIKNGSWLSRQMQDLSYTNRVAKEYLASVINYHNIFPAKGAFVQQIKRDLKFATPIKNELKEIVNEHQEVKLPFQQNYFEVDQGKKNRTHHYHHIIDSFVVALCNKKFYDKFNRDMYIFYQENKDAKSIADAKATYINKEISHNIGILKKQLEQKLADVVVSYKPEHNTNSRFLKETATGKISENDTTRSESHKNKDYNFVANTALSAFKNSDIENIRDPKLRVEIRNYVFATASTPGKIDDKVLQALL